MQVITTRVDESDADALAEVEIAEKADKSTVVRKLLTMGLKQWRIESAVAKLSKREVSIRKASEIARIPYSDMLELMAKRNIDIGYSASDIESDIASLRK